MFEVRVWKSEDERAADVPALPGGLRCYATSLEAVLTGIGVQLELLHDNGVELSAGAA